MTFESIRRTSHVSTTIVIAKLAQTINAAMRYDRPSLGEEAASRCSSTTVA
jgi:hypothetical protein